MYNIEGGLLLSSSKSQISSCVDKKSIHPGMAVVVLVVHH